MLSQSWIPKAKKLVTALRSSSFGTVHPPHSRSAKRLPVTMEIKSKPQHARHLESSTKGIINHLSLRSNNRHEPVVWKGLHSLAFQHISPATWYPCNNHHRMQSFHANSKTARLSMFDKHKIISQHRETVVFVLKSSSAKPEGNDIIRFFPSFQEHIQHNVYQGQRSWSENINIL